MANFITCGTCGELLSVFSVRSHAGNCPTCGNPISEKSPDIGLDRNETPLPVRSNRILYSVVAALSAALICSGSLCVYWYTSATNSEHASKNLLKGVSSPVYKADSAGPGKNDTPLPAGVDLSPGSAVRVRTEGATYVPSFVYLLAVADAVKSFNANDYESYVDMLKDGRAVNLEQNTAVRIVEVSGEVATVRVLDGSQKGEKVYLLIPFCKFSKAD